MKTFFIASFMTTFMVVEEAFAHSSGSHAQGGELWEKWTLDPSLYFFALTVVLYFRGVRFCSWYKLRHKASFLLGTFLAVISLASPVDYLADYSFSWHMVQHIVLMMWAAPLWICGSPLVACLRGVPLVLRNLLVIPLGQSTVIKKYLAFQLHPGVATFTYVGVNIFWHVPIFYDLALESNLVHYIEHFCFWLASVFFFWSILRPFPMPSRGHLWRIVWLVAANLGNSGLGAALSWSTEVYYNYTRTVSPLIPSDVLQDQVLGGVYMWVGGGMMYLFFVLIVLLEFSKEASALEPAWEPS